MAQCKGNNNTCIPVGILCTGRTAGCTGIEFNLFCFNSGFPCQLWQDIDWSWPCTVVAGSSIASFLIIHGSGLFFSQTGHFYV